MYFFDDENSLDDEQCSSFLGDGICNLAFNIPDYEYDQGDCCAAICDDLHCGVGTMTEVFDTKVNSGNGFPYCKDPEMKPITILLNDVYLPEENGFVDDNSPFSDFEPRDPLMILDCDGANLLMVNVDVTMTNKTETVMVDDGADCTMTVKNATSGSIPIWYVNYTVFHGDKESIDSDPIVMIQGDSLEEEVYHFQRIRECFIVKIDDYVDKTTIYTGTDPSNQAIDWLMDDSLGFSNCEDDQFIERYALAVINFAAPIFSENQTEGLWITTERQCVWRNVACIDGRVTELDLGSLSGIILEGTVATEIGLLQNLAKIDMSKNEIPVTLDEEAISIRKRFVSICYQFNPNSTHIVLLFEFCFSRNVCYLGNNYINGTIPSEIGQWENLIYIGLGK